MRICAVCCAELDLDHEIDWRVTRTGFFTGSGLYHLNNAVDYLKFPALNLIDKLRLGTTILYMARIKDGRRLESVPLVDWLVSLSGRRVFEQIWRPLLAAKLGDNYKKASASFIWSYARRFYAARQGGMKTEMFGYVPGGYARILERFTAKLEEEGVDIRLASPVDRITPKHGGFAVTTGGGEALDFDRVVVTAAAPLAARICEGLTQDERDRLEGVVYNGVICASLLLRRPLGGYYLTYITDRSIPFTAVIEMSALVDAQRHLGGHSLVYLPRYVTGDDAFWGLSDEELERQFIAGLQEDLPDARRPRHRRLPGRPGAAGLRRHDAELFRAPAADDHLGARPRHRQLRPHRQRQPCGQRDGRTGRSDGSATAGRSSLRIRSRVSRRL